MIRALCALGTGVVLVALVAVANPAMAHGELERSEPADGAVVNVAPEQVHAWFTQELFRRAGENALDVSTDDGERVAGEVVIDDSDRTHMYITFESPLEPGTYVVRWQSLSATDGDSASGEFSFTFDPVATTAATNVPSPEANESDGPATGEGNGTDWLLLGVLVVAGIAIVGGLALVMWRLRAPPEGE